MEDKSQPKRQGVRALIFHKAFRRKSILKGTVYFLTFTVLGMAILFFTTRTPQTYEALHYLEARYFLVAVALSVLDMQLGGWRNHLFVRKIDPGVPGSVSWKANVANIFLGAVTPSQSGGGVAQLFIYYRAGVPVAKSVSVSIINFIATLVFFLVFAVYALYIARGHVVGGAVLYLIRYGFVAFIGLFMTMTLIAWKPDRIGRWIFRRLGVLFSRKADWRKKYHRFYRRFIKETIRYREQCRHFCRKEPALLLYSIIVTCILYVNKFTLGYFLMRGLGFDGDFMVMMAIQTLILFILYFCPSPGGSGIAELTIAGLMTILIPKHILPVYTLLYRFFLLYLPAALGSVVLLTELKRQQKEI